MLEEDEMIKFNEEAFNGFNENALVPCHHCGRTFLPDSLKIHRKICTAEKPFKPLNRAKKAKYKAEKQSMEERPVGGRRRQAKEPRPKPAQRRNQNLYKKKPAQRANRNFYEDSDEDKEIMNNYSYSRPKKGAHLNKKEPASTFGAKRKAPAKRAPKYGTQPMNGRKQRRKEPSYDFEEPEEEEWRPQRKRPAAKAKPKPRARARPKPKPRAQPEVTYDFSGPPANLEPCRHCGRSFAEDRIKKHISICRIQASKKTKVKRFHKKLTTKEKRKIERKKPVSKWKAQHQEFVKQMRYMRKLKRVEEQGGDIREIAPPPPSAQPGLVPCRHCGRRFREQAHGRHEKICKTVFGGKKGPTRPKKTRQQRRRGY